MTHLFPPICNLYANQHSSHKYLQLPLIPIEEFLAQHPEHSNADENELMYARIEHERAERETLESRRQELLKRKQKLIAENTRRKDDLANLDQDLEKFIDVCYNLRYIIDTSTLLTLFLHRPPNLSWSFSKKRLEDEIDCDKT